MIASISPDNAPWVFLGYRAKKPWVPEGDWGRGLATAVAEVCSVGECLAEPPPGWVDRWDFNRASCYGSAQEAWTTVPPNDRSSYRVFAYWMIPATTDEHGTWSSPPLSEWFDERLPPLPTGPEPKDLHPIGFDVVSRERRSLGWSCSPLSCNGMAATVPVNAFCLVEKLGDALTLVERWNSGVEAVEPGEYVVVMVAMTETGS